MANNRAACDPCCNPEEVVRNNETFKWAVIAVLCAIQTNTGSGGGGVVNGTPVETTPTIANATSVTLAAAKADRKYLLIQNNSAANIMVSLSGLVLTGIVPTSTNKGIVIQPGGNYETPPNYATVTAITVYQISGGSINTVSVVEG